MRGVWHRKWWRAVEKDGWLDGGCMFSKKIPFGGGGLGVDPAKAGKKGPAVSSVQSFKSMRSIQNTM